MVKRLEYESKGQSDIRHTTASSATLPGNYNE